MTMQLLVYSVPTNVYCLFSNTHIHTCVHVCNPLPKCVVVGNSYRLFESKSDTTKTVCVLCVYVVVLCPSSF